MEQQFLKIDPNINEEQLYYPPLDFTFNPKINLPQEDKFFVDKTIKYEKEDCYSDRITRTDINTFQYKDSMSRMFVIGPLVIGFILGLIIVIKMHFSLNSLIYGIIPFLSTFIPSIIMDCYAYSNVNLKLEPNSIVLVKKSIFRRKTFVYNIWDLEKFALYYNYDNNSEQFKHKYTLYFVKKEGKKDKYKEFSSKNMDNDFGGVKYFIDLVNSHIHSNMS